MSRHPRLPGCTAILSGSIHLCAPSWPSSSGELEGVVSLGQHDLLQNGLESRPHRSKLLRRLGGESRPDFGDEVVDRPRRRAVL